MKINLNAGQLKKIMTGLIMILLLNFGAAQAQPQQGLMSKLIEIKYSTELYLTTQLKNETNSAKKDSALALYNTMRWKVDGFVYQLSSDLITVNSIRKYKKINSNYSEDLKDINTFYEKHIEPRIYNQARNLNLTTNVFYLLKDSYSIIKGLSDIKTRKTMAIVEMLDHARLLTPGEVGKGVNREIIIVK
jgi:hypothetical protein